jgi:hypothetical protein
VNDVERLALALTLIELGNDVADFGRNRRIFVKSTYENREQFIRVMNNHLESFGHTC